MPFCGFFFLPARPSGVPSFLVALWSPHRREQTYKKVKSGGVRTEGRRAADEGTKRGEKKKNRERGTRGRQPPCTGNRTDRARRGNESRSLSLSLSSSLAFTARTFPTSSHPSPAQPTSCPSAAPHQKRGRGFCLLSAVHICSIFFFLTLLPPPPTSFIDVTDTYKSVLPQCPLLSLPLPFRNTLTWGENELRGQGEGMRSRAQRIHTAPLLLHSMRGRPCRSRSASAHTRRR